jgi:hypothetical protein
VEGTKNVIDGNIKMYLKMHHIDSFMKFRELLENKFIAICDSILFYDCLPPRGVEQSVFETPITKHKEFLEAAEYAF